jgi:dUTP pyrophosphatase
MIAYLAHPIDLVGENDDATHQKLRYDVRNDLALAGFVIYDPEDAFVIGDGARPEQGVSQINLAAMQQADVFVVLRPEAQTIGTVLELAYAVANRKPTVVVSRAVDKSWSLAGFDDNDQVLVTNAWDPGHAGWLWQLAEVQPTKKPVQLLKYAFNDEAGSEAYARGFWPERRYSGDAGFDLYVTQEVEIPIGKFADIPCGINVELPEDTWGMIFGRSSTLRTHNLLVMPGVIDQGYRGPLYAGVYNMNGTQFSARIGMRLAQLIPFPLTARDLIAHWVPSLADSDRGTRGFGSTGR